MKWLGTGEEMREGYQSILADFRIQFKPFRGLSVYYHIWCLPFG